MKKFSDIDWFCLACWIFSMVVLVANFIKGNFTPISMVQSFTTGLLSGELLFSIMRK